MRGNAFFEEMYRIGCEWSKAHKAHEELKEQIIATKGWDSPELKAWYAEEEQMKFPFSSGANKAFRAWRYTEGEEVIMDDFCWDRERHDFIDALRQAGIRSFVVTNQSTGLMEDIHGYIAEGCRLEGPCTIIKKDSRWGEETEETIQGLRFTL
jgi:hypothetical protein